MGFYDGKGIYRIAGENFYDGKGIMRGPNENYYDSKGFYRTAGENFYDGKGIMRGPNENYYDSKGFMRKSDKKSSNIYSDMDTIGSGNGDGIGAFGEIIYFLIKLGIYLIGIALACYCIFGMWYFVYNAMSSSGTEGYVNTGIIVTSMLIVTIIIIAKYESYIYSVFIFYVANTAITYVALNISAIIFDDFGFSSIFGGAFIVLCLNIIPSFIMPGIATVIVYLYILAHKIGNNDSNKKLPKKISHKTLRKMYDNDKDFHEAAIAYGKSSANKSLNERKFNLAEAYENDKKVRKAAYKYLKRHNMLK